MVAVAQASAPLVFFPLRARTTKAVGDTDFMIQVGQPLSVPRQLTLLIPYA